MAGMRQRPNESLADLAKRCEAALATEKGFDGHWNGNGIDFNMLAMQHGEQRAWEEFRKKYGPDYVLASGSREDIRTGDSINQRYLWFSGAVWIKGSRFIEPFEHTPKQLLLVKRDYLQIRIENECEAFNNFRNSCIEQHGYFQRSPSLIPPGCTAQAVAQLKAGQKRITDLRNQWAALTEQIDERKVPDRLTQQREVAEAFHQAQLAACNAAAEEMKNITI